MLQCVGLSTLRCGLDDALGHGQYLCRKYPGSKLKARICQKSMQLLPRYECPPHKCCANRAFKRNEVDEDLNLFSV